MTAQPGILLPLPPRGRALTFRMVPGRDPQPALSMLGEIGEDRVFGLGASLVAELGGHVDGLRPHPSWAGPGCSVPGTGGDLWVWLRGQDPGVLFHQGRALADALAPAFALEDAVDTFVHRDSRDLSGYVDGTENPKGEDAREAAFVAGAGQGLDGGSFVAVERWVHDLRAFAALDPQEQDYTIGRTKEDDVELTDAPAYAHVKRSAQESFEPEAFVLRRSMPWTEGDRAGLNFVAFGRSFEAFEAILHRMLGLDDGIPDALFRFTRPVTGAYFWCPPLDGTGRLDLRALVLG